MEKILSCRFLNVGSGGSDFSAQGVPPFFFYESRSRSHGGEQENRKDIG